MNNNQLRCEALYHNVILDSMKQYKPCCLIQGWDIPPGIQVDELVHTDPYRHMRDDMMNGVWPAACKRCEKAESEGYLSMRQRISAIYENSPLEPVITSMEVRTNVCNLKCHTCNPRASSALIPIYNELNTLHNTNAYNDIQLTTMSEKRNALSEVLSMVINGTLTTFTFIGGEPLLDATTLATIEHISANNTPLSLELFLITNLMVSRDTMLQYAHAIRDCIPYIKRFNIQISCDGYGTASEFTRDGFKWATFEQNIAILQDVLGDHITSSELVIQINSVMVIPFLDTFEPYLKWCRSNLHPGIRLKFGEYHEFNPFGTRAVFLNDVRYFTDDQLGGMVERFLDIIKKPHPNIRRRQRDHAVKYIISQVGTKSALFEPKLWREYMIRRVELNERVDWYHDFINRHQFFRNIINESI